MIRPARGVALWWHRRRHRALEAQRDRILAATALEGSRATRRQAARAMGFRRAPARRGRRAGRRR